MKRHRGACELDAIETALASFEQLLLTVRNADEAAVTVARGVASIEGHLVSVFAERQKR